jgi:hypothetical protein
MRKEDKKDIDIEKFTEELSKLSERQNTRNNPNKHELIDNTKIGSIKKAIEYFNLWYLIECKHCETLFLIEDSIDKRFLSSTKSNRKNMTFNAFCPNCGTKNEKLKATGRLKLLVERKTKDSEYSDAVNDDVKNLPKELDIELGLISDKDRLERNYAKKKKRKQHSN